MHQQQVSQADQQDIKRRKFNVNSGALVGGVADGALEFAFRRANNPEESIATSAAFAGATAAAWYFLPHFMWAKTAYDVSKSVGEAAYQARRGQYGKAFSQGKQTFGGNFEDNAFNATMRQRGVAAMQQSKIQARSFLGGEARSLHRY